MFDSSPQPRVLHLFQVIIVVISLSFSFSSIPECAISFRESFYLSAAQMTAKLLCPPQVFIYTVPQ